MTLDHFKQVCAFNAEIIKYPQPDSIKQLSEDEAIFVNKVIVEELTEFWKGIKDANVPDQVDALIDLVYFAFGGLYKMGVRPEQFDLMFDAVHKANMTKKKGITKRGHENDAAKPEEWREPKARLE